MVLVTPLPPKLEDFPKLVDTSSQVGTPDEGEMDDPTPEDIPALREAETTCAHSIKEAEAHCSTAIWEAEAQGASQASSIQQSHAKSIQLLEEEAIEEENKDQLNFLSACQAALEASPLKSGSMLLASYQVLLEHTLTFHLFSIPQGASPSQQGLTPGASSPSAHTMPRPSPRPKWWHHSPDMMDILPLSKAMSKATPKGPPV